MPDRKIPRPFIPAGIGHFYRASNLTGLHLALWEDGRAGPVPLLDYLRDAGASVVVFPVAAGEAPPTVPPVTARRTLDAARRPEARIALPAARVRPGLPPPAPVEVDAGVLSLHDPNPLARRLQSARLPFVIFTEWPERCLAHYPAGSCVHTEDGPEALASAVLLHVAIFHSGLHLTPGMSVMEMLPRLQAMARVLVHDAALADELVAEAMEQALNLVPTLASEEEVGPLLLMLMERLWYRQKLSRPN